MLPEAGSATRQRGVGCWTGTLCRSCRACAKRARSDQLPFGGGVAHHRPQCGRPISPPCQVVRWPRPVGVGGLDRFCLQPSALSNKVMKVTARRNVCIAQTGPSLPCKMSSCKQPSGAGGFRKFVAFHGTDMSKVADSDSFLAGAGSSSASSPQAKLQLPSSGDVRCQPQALRIQHEGFRLSGPGLGVVQSCLPSHAAKRPRTDLPAGAFADWPRRRTPWTGRLRMWRSQGDATPDPNLVSQWPFHFRHIGWASGVFGAKRLVARLDISCSALQEPNHCHPPPPARRSGSHMTTTSALGPARTLPSFGDPCQLADIQVHGCEAAHGFWWHSQISWLRDSVSGHDLGLSYTPSLITADASQV